VDGDTVDVELNGKTERLRLIGIDTPEVVDPREPVQCFGREASARAHALLDGKTVRVEGDATQDTRDKYQRMLAYVWLPDGTLFNKAMVADGYAFEYTYDQPYRFQAEFKAAQQDAHQQNKGLWSPSTCNGEHKALTADLPTGPSPGPSPHNDALPPSVRFTSVVGGRPGGRASASVQTPPQARCSIMYVTPAGTISQAQGLVAVTATAAGVASWSWVIGSNTTPGTGTVTVNCAGVSARADIVISR
jgi:endonuclease YncB( thermonuclease family)